MPKQLLIILIALLIETVWLGIFKYVNYNQRMYRKMLLWLATTFPGINSQQLAYILGTLVYILPPFFGGWLLLSLVDVSLIDVFSVVSKVNTFYLVFVAYMASMMMSILATNLLTKFIPEIDIPGHIRKTPWIKTALIFPKKVIWIFPFISASFEEFFFRGALFFALLEIGLSFWLATAIVTLAFVVNQVVLVDDWVQGLVIGLGSVSISLIGCLMVGITHSVVPSMMMHAAYAGFFVNMNDNFG